MKLTTLATGSEGNCYFLENNDREILILDAGISSRLIFKGISFRLRNVVGCLITHEHKDHSLAADSLRRSGIALYEPYKKAEVPKVVRMGGYSITAFQVPHDGTTNYGFFIRSDGESMVYITDYEYCPVTFRKQAPNMMLLECNYVDEYVSPEQQKYDHVLRGHASLETVQKIIAVNRTDKLDKVVLCHISKGNGDPERMAAEIAERNPTLPVYIATPGRTLNING